MLKKIEFNCFNKEEKFKTNLIKFDYQIKRHYEEDKIKGLTVKKNVNLLSLLTDINATFLKECENLNNVCIEFGDFPNRRYIFLYEENDDGNKSCIVTFSYEISNQLLSNGLCNEMLILLDTLINNQLLDTINTIKCIYGENL